MRTPITPSDAAVLIRDGTSAMVGGFLGVMPLETASSAVQVSEPAG
jgi:hypothetical protein